MATREKLKASKREELKKERNARATLRNLQMSARKVRVVADVIRGMPVEQALVTLQFQQRAAAKPLRRLLDSAIANADQKGLNVDKLVVEELLVHGAAIRPRFMPRAHGRATKVRKRSSHVDVKLSVL